MNQNGFDKEKILSAIQKESGGRIDSAALENAQKGDLSKMMRALSQEDKQKLSQMLANKTALKELLSRPEAKDLLKNFMNGGKKHG